jgi:TetR/AcrR family transcriptional regulator
MQLFARKGYDAVGVQEIVDAAGITKPTLYHYFGSKRGLLDSIIAENMSKFFPQLEETAEYKRDITNSLNRLTLLYFNFAQKHRDFYRMLLSMWFAPPESEVFKAIFPVMERQQRIFEDLFLKAANDHGNMKGRHRIYASTFLGMLNTYIGLLLNDFVKPDNNLVYRLVHQYMHGIFS